MFIYLLVIALIILMKIHLNGVPINDRQYLELNYLRVVCFILVAIAALRSTSVGSDTYTYVDNYLNMSFTSFRDILYEKADFPVYYLLSKICSVLNMPVPLFLGLIECIYIYSIYRFIKAFSEDKLYTILCFTTIGLYAFSLAGLKQTLSMSFVLLFFISFVNKKYITMVIYAVLAFFSHQSSLIFLFGVLLYCIRNWKIYYYALAGVVILSLFGTTFLWSNLLLALNTEHYIESYMADEGYSPVTLIFYGILVFIMFVFGKDYRRIKPIESRFVFGVSLLAFAFQAFASVSASAFRLSYFFLPFMIIGFPNHFNNISDVTNKRLVRIIVASIIVFFFVYTNRNGSSIVPYKFFWQ